VIKTLNEENSSPIKRKNSPTSVNEQKEKIKLKFIEK
jgi:hypothetical protein